jgi:hypothetical protein
MDELWMDEVWIFETSSIDCERVVIRVEMFLMLSECSLNALQRGGAYFAFRGILTVPTSNVDFLS